MNRSFFSSIFLLVGVSGAGFSAGPKHKDNVPRAKPYLPTDGGRCFHAGPQAPRDISIKIGQNPSVFPDALPHAQMNLCNIHFHRSAEHKGPGFSTLHGNGIHEGYICDGSKPPLESQRKHEGDGCYDIGLGDTIEVHWVFTTCEVDPGKTLAACMNPNCQNPNLRVEARVFVLTEGVKGEFDFDEYRVKGHHPKHLPVAKNEVSYMGSTTGPKFTDKICSPYQVSWHVGTGCAPLKKSSLDKWCDKNVFGERHAHGVRKIVKDPRILSKIK